jgi:hypothetical protein
VAFLRVSGKFNFLWAGAVTSDPDRDPHSSGFWVHWLFKGLLSVLAHNLLGCFFFLNGTNFRSPGKYIVEEINSKGKTQTRENKTIKWIHTKE